MKELSRRDFLSVTASSGIVAAGYGFENNAFLISSNKGMDVAKPGQWAFLSTTCRECPAGCGMYMWHRDARSTKAEGMPGHPVNDGALCPRGQSSVQGHFDPDRLRRIRRAGSDEPVGWRGALDQIGAQLRDNIVVVLSQLETGALAEVMRSFAGAFGADSTVLFYEAFNYQPLRDAHRLLFDQPVVPFYRLDRSNHIVSFAADFLETWVSPVQFARQYAQFRLRPNARFDYVGPRLSMTAANADALHKVSPSQLAAFAMAVVRKVGEREALPNSDAIRQTVDAFFQTQPEALERLDARQVDEVARGLDRGGIALAGPTGATGDHAATVALAAGLINAALGNETVDLSRPHALSRTARVEETESALASLDERTALIILETNPAYTSPGVAEYIARAGLSIYLGTLPTETAALCDWVLPADSPLEMWGDYEPYAGMHDFMQPVTTRLHDTRHPGDILLALAARAGKPLRRQDGAEPAADFPEWLEARWRDLHRRAAPDASFEAFRESALRKGGVFEPVPTRDAPTFAPDMAGIEKVFAASRQADGLELWLWPTIHLFDGRTANRRWLQEAPEPVSFAAWGTWVDVHPRDAAQLGVKTGDVVAIGAGAASIGAPVRVTDDVLPGTVAVPLGQGHSVPDTTAYAVGANAFLLQSSKPDVFFGRVALTLTGKHEPLAFSGATQDQHDRHLLQWTGESRATHGETPVTMPLAEGYEVTSDLYPPREYTYHRWAMAVDLNKCIGCGACAVACYAENNIGIVGKENMLEGREMAWLKIVPYRHPTNTQRVAFLPMACQQCDAAPCEPVCPVFASVHNEEGLNAQVYNRCIGTRYCSHNCPYKVRRFNWSNLEWPYPSNLQLNPEVTVRCRGVMEKCTFCIQRIRRVEFQAKREGRPVRDGEVVPACAQTCPTGAIVFGDLLDENALVTKIFRTAPRRYQVLKELNTKPAIVYLQRMIGGDSKGRRV